MADLPVGVTKHSETPLFTETTVPAKLTARHDTKPGVWGRLVVVEGALDYVVPGPPETRQRVSAGGFAIIEPELIHHVSLMGPVAFRVEFYK